MIAIFCETPYQLLSALNVAYSVFNEECDLYIMRDMFKSDIKFDIGVKSAGFVKSIKNVVRGNPAPSFLRRIKLRLYRAFMGWEKRDILYRIPKMNFSARYDKFICIKYSGAAEQLYKYYKGAPEVYQVEEGIGEYLVFDDIISDGRLGGYTKCKFISEPSLYPVESKIKMVKAPPLSVEKEFAEVINTIFNYRQDLGRYKRFIYFGQAFSQDYQNPAFDNIERQCFEIFADELGKGDLSVKKHPRNITDLSDTFESIHTMAPWECCINELEDTDNRILISISSTALITPKLMCDKEPYLLILAALYEPELKKIYPEKNYYSKMMTLFNNIKELYRDPEKVFIPKTMEELRTAVEYLNKETDKK